jgi:hypothetical protein
MKGIGDILNKLQKVKKLSNGEFQACCPAHEDKTPSLNLRQENDTILIKCQAGCPTENIVSVLGLTMADLFIKDEQPTKQQPAKIVATYDYQDEKGQLLYQVVRMDPKDFRQRHRNGNGEWKWDMEGIRRVLYHLPEILLASDSEKVYLVEGEKDADNLWKVGRVATTSPGGAKNWKPEYAHYLAGKNIVVIPDKDSAGFGYAKDAIRSLDGKARDIKVIILPGENNKDVSDWLSAFPEIDLLDTYEQSIDVLMDPDRPHYETKDDQIIWRKTIEDRVMIFASEKLSEERTGIHAKISIKCDYASLAWSYFNVERSEDRIRLANSAHKQLKGDITKAYAKEDLQNDLDNFCAGLWEYHVSTFVPELLEGDETEQPLKFALYPYIIDNGGTIVYAPPGRGKSYTALLWAISVNNGCRKFWQVEQVPTLFINLERSKNSLQVRIARVNKVLGLSGKTPLHVLNARGKTLSEVLPACRSYVQKYNIGMIVLDSISRAGYGDLNDNQPMNKIVDCLSSLCPTWLALSHTSRANEDHAFGSIMLDAGADICVQLASQILEDGTLGVGWEITKQNDVGKKPQKIYTLLFNEYGLCDMRIAKDGEFPEIEGKRKRDMVQTLIDYILNKDTGDATASDAESALGFNRSNISTVLNSSGKFYKTRRIGTSQYFGVLTSEAKQLL